MKITFASHLQNDVSHYAGKRTIFEYRITDKVGEVVDVKITLATGWTRPHFIKALLISLKGSKMLPWETVSLHIIDIKMELLN